MFPDAFQDRFLKSLGSSRSRSNHSSSGRQYHVAPPYSDDRPKQNDISSNKRQSNSERFGSTSANKNHSPTISCDCVTRIGSKHNVNNIERNNMPLSVRTTMRSEMKNSSQRKFSLSSHSAANSEPIQKTTTLNEYNIQQTHGENRRHALHQKRATDSGVEECPIRNPLSHQQHLDRHSNEAASRHSLMYQDQNIHDIHSNKCFSEPLKKSDVRMNSIYKSISHDHDRRPFPPHQRIHKNIRRGDDHRWQNNHNNNKMGPSFDDASTIPSEDHFIPKHDVILSVPSSIKYSEGRNHHISSPVKRDNEHDFCTMHSKNHDPDNASGHSFSHGSLRENREDPHISIPGGYSVKESTRELMSPGRNAPSLSSKRHDSIESEARRNIQSQTSNASKSLSHRGSYSTIDLELPVCHTDPTVASSSLDSSRVYSISDKYRSAELEKSISDRNRQDDNFSQKQPLGTVKTPTTSNMTSSFSMEPPKELNIQSHGRLEILQEIGISMEMKMKAKIAQEKSDYEFWVRHIEKLNAELEGMEFPHEQDSFRDKASSRGSDLPKSKDTPRSSQSIQTQRSEKTLSILKNRTPSDQEKSQQGKDRPISILKPPKSKTRIIKIRAPSNLKAGHVFSVNFKGQEIRATVVSDKDHLFDMRKIYFDLFC